jgi:hypothetical protein
VSSCLLGSCTNSCSEIGTKSPHFSVYLLYQQKSWRLRRLPTVNIARILAELKAERSRLDRAIAALEKLALAAQKRKKAAPSTPAQRRARKGLKLPPKERGKLIVFRKLRKSGSKPAQAEEA